MREENGIDHRLWYMRRPAQFLLDLAVLCGALFLAFLPSINIQLSDYNYYYALNQVPFVVFVQFSALFLFGAYSIIWRYISIGDIKVFIKAALLSGSILLALRFLLTLTDFRVWQVPISVILIDTVLAFGGMLALRIIRRTIYEFSEKNQVRGSRKKIKRKPTLIVGAGRMGANLAKEMLGRSDAELEIRGFVDDDQRKGGGSLSGIKVLGTTADLPRLVDELSIRQVVIAIDEAQGKEIRRILDVCSVIPVKAQIVPSLNEIAHGRVSVSRIRNVEIEDLLGRDPVDLDDKNLHEFLAGKTVMVTGAGGSIGSELVRQITNYDPKNILLVERAEFLLFEAGRELVREYPQTAFVPLIADAGDEPRMREIFERYSPSVIFHAAAHKHVPLMEVNPLEAVKNNVFATYSVANLAGRYGADAFVLVSTDKAVNPTSIMGASKRVAEIAVQSLEHKYATNYVAVRFGNVLGSAGSVVPIFREQIRKGAALTVTHKDMTRYFMTIPEASQLVLQAGALGEGGEIFVLDMGRPVRILDLAEDMVRLSGLTPYEDIDIVFTGVRQGEKLFEELEISGENLVKTLHPKIFIGKIAAYSPADVGRILADFGAAVESNSEERVRHLFNATVPEGRVQTREIAVAATDAAKDGKYFTRTSKLGLAEK
ncbi:MAG: nucleoside-diphosphate sugar epimerase/dehydratase [Acidobacteriota bacterium]